MPTTAEVSLDPRELESLTADVLERKYLESVSAQSGDRAAVLQVMEEQEKKRRRTAEKGKKTKETDFF